MLPAGATPEFPACASLAPASLIDLTSFFNAALNQTWHGTEPNNDLSFYPDGLPALQLFRTIRENPRPDLAVERLDYLSALNTAAPFLIAITVEP